jgi:hypothetical protein
MYGIQTDSDIFGCGIYNCTVYGIAADGSGTAAGISHATNSGNKRSVNNIVMGVTSGSGTATDFLYAGSSGFMFNNMSEDASADDQGSGHLVSKTPSSQFVSLTGGAEDLHLKAGADAIGAGVDLVDEPTGVKYDIDGYDRDAAAVTWDIGADQYVAESSALPWLYRAHTQTLGAGFSRGAN